MDYCEKLKHYLDDCDENIDLIKEAIASLEGHFELISEKELLHFNRVDAIAYLALKSIVRCKDCKHGEKCAEPHKDYWCNLYEGYKWSDWFCADGEKKE